MTTGRYDANGVSHTSLGQAKAPPQEASPKNLTSAESANHQTGSESRFQRLIGFGRRSWGKLICYNNSTRIFTFRVIPCGTGTEQRLLGECILNRTDGLFKSSFCLFFPRVLRLTQLRFPISKTRSIQLTRGRLTRRHEGTKRIGFGMPVCLRNASNGFLAASQFVFIEQARKKRVHSMTLRAFVSSCEPSPGHFPAMKQQGLG